MTLRLQAAGLQQLCEQSDRLLWIERPLLIVSMSQRPFVTV